MPLNKDTDKNKNGIPDDLDRWLFGYMIGYIVQAILLIVGFALLVDILRKIGGQLWSP